tara:strand:- start:481 stop:618 length:138 start_codon:yes stop_codon:yes gene_type:complete
MLIMGLQMLVLMGVLAVGLAELTLVTIQVILAVELLGRVLMVVLL